MLTLYVICFWVGLLLTLILTLFGGGHGHHHFFHFEAGDHGSAGHGGPSPINLNSFLVFLTGFGGIGFLLDKVGFFNSIVILVIALLSGVLLAWILFLVLVKVFLRGERVMQESDYDLTGMLAYVSSSIPEKGIGEIKYTLEGMTRSIGARSKQGKALPKGMKVIIMDVSKGIATVIEFEQETEVL